MIKRMTNWLGVAWAMFVLCGVVEAAPFARNVPYVQPDGTAIVLWGQGDEFCAVFETLDGYTVVFDQPSRAYHYARLSADGNALESTGLWVGKGDPQTLGLAKHVRVNAQAVQKLARARQATWENGTGIAKRWNALKTARRKQALAMKSGNLVLSPPSSLTVGNKLGLTLLIDFDDDLATVSQSEIDGFCNGDSYTGYGNNGSVKKYYQDVSGGMLIYSNVVTVYIRIPNSLHKKSWYNDTSKDAGYQANYLIRDAIAIMKALPNYTLTILPTFTNLTVDADNRVVAFNVFYAGSNGGVWAKGLWPHSGSLSKVEEQSLSTGGKQLYNYEVTNIGASLELGTFCHENGHMLCGYPDLYDYDYNSTGGAGNFCLMGYGAIGGNPVQICAYLKRASGWAPATEELDYRSSLIASVSSGGADFNKFYRYQKPGMDTEYYLMENRQKTGRDALILPGGGVAVWHIDELGDRDNQSLLTNSVHANYEVTLVQADNLWHFENYENYGDANDLYYIGNIAAGYVNRISSNTAPNSSWWDGSPSKLTLSDFSVNGMTMTFKVESVSTIEITPAAGVRFQGPFGGPFAPSNSLFTIANQATSAINWSVTCDRTWLDLSPTSGVLSAGASSLVVIVPNSNAAALPLGFYPAGLTFSDTTHSSEVAREVYLQVGIGYTLCSEPYLWNEPASATALSFTSGVSAAISMPFDFSFYGQTYSNLYVTSHGLIGFGDPSNLGTAAPLPLGMMNLPYAILSPLWSDLNAAVSPGNVAWGVVGSASNRQLIVRWTNARSSSEPAATNTFQVVIHEAVPGADNDILFQYRNAAQDAPLTGGGRAASIGIQDQVGQGATEYSSGGSSLLADGMGMRFTMQPPADTDAPVPAVRVLTENGSALTFEVRFNEIVTGMLTPDDFDVGGTLSNVTAVTAVSGNGNGVYGLRYLVTVSMGGGYGSVSLTVRGGVIKDLSGNWNMASDPCTYVRPFHDAVFRDDMEYGPDGWVTSGSNNLSQIVLNAWQYGVPTSPYGPGIANSPSNCWGVGLTSACPNNVWATLESPPITVGDAPVVNYATWYAFNVTNAYGYGFGYVEVFDGTGWYDVTPNSFGFYWGGSGGWITESVTLDSAQFGNRSIRVRFRVRTYGSPETQGGMFVDDVQVSSRRNQGVWVTAFTPMSANAGSVTSLWFTAYNSMTATLYGVSASVATPDAGINLTGRVAYGDMAPGAIVTGSTPVTATLGQAGNFLSPNVSLFHSVTSTVGVVGQQTLAFLVSGVAPAAGTNLLWVKLASGSAAVVDWLGSPLTGDSGPASSLFQVIAAGTNGAINPPGSGGQVTGGDKLLYEYGGVAGYGRFGVGGVPPNAGQFRKAFTYNLTASNKVYIRAWDAASVDASVAYGESTGLVLKVVATQTNEYPGWIVRTPWNYTRDLNGDGIPDGWCVLSGMDPRAPAAALPTAWVTNGLATQTSGYPNRIAVWSNYVYVTQGADGFGPLGGQISIWSRNLATNLGTFGSSGFGTNQFSSPRGLAVHPTSNLLAVADTKNNRIVVLAITPTNGALTWRFSFGGAFGTTNVLSKPQGVAIAPDGRYWVADTGNNALKEFDTNGVHQALDVELGLAQPQSVTVATNYFIYVADTGNNRIRILDADHNPITPITNLTGGVGQPLSLPSDVQIGVDGRIYVADQNNHRIQVFGANFLFQGVFGAYGSGDGQLHTPRGLWPARDDGLLYVADTSNNRVVRMRTVFDLDGDGMDDVWEDLHGLNSQDPSDAFLDPDGDGVTNLGEYRVGTDPHKFDTNGNGASDLWDMQNRLNPGSGPVLSNPPPRLRALTCNVTGRPVVYGEMVQLTATFNKAMTNAPPPNLGLDGGATLSATPMTKTATNTFVLAYAVQATDAGGAVNASINGAQDMTGLPSDPMTLASNGVFAVTSEVIRISAVARVPYVVNWSAISSFVYQVQSAPLLPTTNWLGVVTNLTASSNGVMSAPVAIPATNREIFYRVKREKPPW